MVILMIIINLSQVVPGESFPCNSEVGEANHINTFEQVLFLLLLLLLAIPEEKTMKTKNKMMMKWTQSQFFRDGPSVATTELCPIEKPLYQALAMQTRWWLWCRWSWLSIKCATICLLCPGLLRTRWRNSAIRVKPGAGWIASMVRHWACHHSPDKIIIIYGIFIISIYYHCRHITECSFISSNVILFLCLPVPQEPCANATITCTNQVFLIIKNLVVLQSLIFNNMANLVLVLLSDHNFPFSCLNSVFSVRQALLYGDGDWELRKHGPVLCLEANVQVRHHDHHRHCYHHCHHHRY